MKMLMAIIAVAIGLAACNSTRGSIKDSDHSPFWKYTADRSGD